MTYFELSSIFIIHYLYSWFVYSLCFVFVSISREPGIFAHKIAQTMIEDFFPHLTNPLNKLVTLILALAEPATASFVVCLLLEMLGGLNRLDPLAVFLQSFNCSRPHFFLKPKMLPYFQFQGCGGLKIENLKTGVFVCQTFY